MKGTLKQTVNKFIFLFVVPLNILLIITNSFFMLSTYRQTKISTENMVNYFLDDIDSRLSTISFFLIKNGTEDLAFQSIAYDYVGRDYALEKIHLYQNLNSKIDLCPEIAYLFMFHSENNEMVIVPSSEYVSHGSYQAKETLCEMLKNPEQFLNASWTLITLQDQQFLLRLFKCNNAYLGVCVPTDSMIQKLKNYSFSNTAVTIAPTGTFTDKNSMLDFFLLRHFQITADSSTGDFSVFLSADIPLQNYITIVLCWITTFFSLCLLSLIPIANTYLQRNILNPILIFIEHMDSIRDNDFSSELTENMGSMEMDHMAASFNTMIHRIQTMKIELYEKELQRTQLDLQCLQLQLSPHFFINTLNTIYFLSINEENLQLQSLTLEFMEYFRAVFKSSSSLIPLRKELEQCSHYISIQQVQKAQKPQVHFNIPDSLTGCMIPPLTILTFLENSIKYAHEQLKLLKLNVSAILQQEDASYYLILTIRDNGVGFPDSLLQDIENYTPPFSIGNEHIGLKNLLSRFYYFYDGNAFIHLCNPKTGGACAEVKIPIEL